MPVKSLIVIPARLASTRLPEKLLRKVAGKTILQHTFAAASRCKVTDKVIVAVDDQRLADEVDSFGGDWIMTSKDCASGTDRIAEVAAAMPDVDVFVNVQGDEPEIEPSVIDLVAKVLIESDAEMSTVGTPIRDQKILNDPSCVKIVMANEPGTEAREPGPEDRAGQGRAVYFSRAAVPYHRDGVDATILAAEPPIYWHHIGLYAYRTSFLKWFASQRPSLLEQTERLEQLRAIEAGKKIVVARVEAAAPGIDTEADLVAFTQRWESRK
jgi:3-deoxy-manno-octulosonate cytidylyltransferase (CMP-KDO synthetase)